MTLAPRFGHLVLRTNRLAAMQDWYCAVLRARVVARTRATVFLTYDEEHHRVALVDPGPLAPAREDMPGLAHTAFAHATVRDLLEAFERLHCAGIDPARAVNHGVTASLYYRDPDGNWVELFADCGPAVTLADVAADESPPWDPAVLAREVEAGATDERLIERLSAMRLLLTPRRSSTG